MSNPVYWKMCLHKKVSPYLDQRIVIITLARNPRFPHVLADHELWSALFEQHILLVSIAHLIVLMSHKCYALAPKGLWVRALPRQKICFSLRKSDTEGISNTLLNKFENKLVVEMRFLFFSGGVCLLLLFSISSIKDIWKYTYPSICNIAKMILQVWPWRKCIEGYLYLKMKSIQVLRLLPHFNADTKCFLSSKCWYVFT